MAKTQNTLIGRSSGSVGGATFSTWKGINVLKSKPLTVANPRTAAQTTTRNMFSAIVLLYRTIATIVKTGFNSQAIKKSEFNAFLSDAMRAGLPIQVGTSLLDWADYQDFLVAKGSMGKTEQDTPNATIGDDTITINWPSTLGLGQASTDKAYAVVIDETGAAQGFSNGAVSRSASSAAISIQRTVAAGQKYHCYLFFKNEETGEVSDSDYVRRDIA